MKRFPRLPALVLRRVLPSELYASVKPELDEVFARDCVRFGRVIAHYRAWREVLGIEMWRLRKRSAIGNRTTGGSRAFFRDYASAMRTLTRSPAHALGVATTLTLGIGICAAVFTVVHSVLIKNIDYVHHTDGGLFSLAWESNGRHYNAFSAADYLDIKRSNRSFESIHAYSPRSFTIFAGTQARRVPGLTVSAGLLETVGAVPHLGRFFSETDDVGGASRVVVLGYGFWQGQFGARPDVIGETLVINDAPHEIVGVAPRWLRFLAPGEDGGSTTVHDEASLFVPNAFAPWRLRVRRAYSYFLLATLSDVTPLAAANDVRAILAEVNQDVPVVVQSFKDHLVGYAKRPLALMSVAALLIFVLSLANAANLVIVRMLAREREFAIRIALGSSWSRALLQLSYETIALVLGAAAAGVVLAQLLLRFMQVGSYLPMFGLESTTTTSIVAVLVLGGTAAATLSIVPFLRGLNAGAGEMSTQTARAARSPTTLRGQRALVVVQLTVSAVVLAAAASIVRSVDNMRQIDIGLSTDNVATYRIALPAEYDDTQKQRMFYADYVARLQSLGGIEAVGLVNFLPFRNHGSMTGPLTVEDRTVEQVYRKAISPGFLSAAGVEILEGRDFTNDDDETRPMVALLSESAARTLFGNDRVANGVVRDADGDPINVVGVVRDVRSERPDQTPQPTMYLPIYHDGPETVSVLLRHTRTTDPVAEARALTRQLDPRIPIFEEAPLSDLVARSIATERIVATLLGIFATISLSIGAVGVYSTMAAIVAHSRAEFGVRMALGATSRSIVQTVMKRALAWGAGGLLLGLALFAMSGKAVSAFLYGIDPMDPVTLSVVGVSLLFLCLLGSALPARRASTVDPIEGLRSDSNW